jgi:hypothetical protein
MGNIFDQNPSSMSSKTLKFYKGRSGSSTGNFLIFFLHFLGDTFAFLDPLTQSIRIQSES